MLFVARQQGNIVILLAAGDVQIHCGDDGKASSRAGELASVTISLANSSQFSRVVSTLHYHLFTFLDYSNGLIKLVAGEYFSKNIEVGILTNLQSFDIINITWSDMETKIKAFLETLDRSPHTIFAYRNALNQFVSVVGEDVDLNLSTYTKFLISIKSKSPATKRVYTTAVRKFYAFHKAWNADELKEATEHYTRSQGKRIVNFNREAVEQVIAYCETLNGSASPSPREFLEALRDRAFVLTLADTGLRISEACALKRADIDWLELRSIIIGKGDKQSVVYYSNRCIEALKAYLHARSTVEPNSRTPLGSQPLFARHDIRASKKIRPITAGGMWKAIKTRIEEAGVERNAVRIHDLRHYFVTMTYLAKGNLKLSQELARHESINTTNRYAHLNAETAKAYDEIFNKRMK